MESELSVIFRVELIAKNIALASPGTQHRALSLCSMMSLSEKKHTNILNQNVRFKCFPC